MLGHSSEWETIELNSNIETSFALNEESEFGFFVWITANFIRDGDKIL